MAHRFDDDDFFDEEEDGWYDEDYAEEEEHVPVQQPKAKVGAARTHALHHQPARRRH